MRTTTWLSAVALAGAAGGLGSAFLEALALAGAAVHTPGDGDLFRDPSGGPGGLIQFFKEHFQVVTDRHGKIIPADSRP